MTGGREIDLLQKLLGVVGAILLVFAGCSLNRSQNNSGVDSGCGSGEAFQEERPSLKIVTKELQSLEGLTEDGYEMAGWGAPDFQLKWVSDTQIVLCAYKVAPFAEKIHCRVFLYETLTDTIAFIKELAFNDVPKVSCFLREQFLNLLFENVHTCTLLSVNLENRTTTTTEEDAGFLPSENGLICQPMDDDGLKCIYEFGKPEQILSQFQTEPDSSFVSWSPDGRYIAFSGGPSYDPGPYRIYTTDGEEVVSIQLDQENGQIRWCKEADFLILAILADWNREKKSYRYELLNLADQTKTPVVFNLSSSDTVILMEQRFTLLEKREEGKSRLYVSDNLSGKQVPVNMNLDISGALFFADYNPDTQTCVLALMMDMDGEKLTC